LRVSPSTFTSVIGSYAAGSQVEIDLVREYTETLLAEYVKIGDKWGRVIKINGVTIAQPAWMAITYWGNAICRPDYVLVGTPPVEPPVPAEQEKIVSLTVVSHYADGSSVTEDFFPVV
jgi:hypothetical protein